MPKRWRADYILRRGAQFATELAQGLARDAQMALRGRPDPVLRLEQGEGLPPGESRGVALYVHYAASGTVSAMVRRQLEAYRALGFRTVFITMAPTLPPEDWEAVRQRVALVVHRRNYGLDFGAWKDLLDEALRRWPAPEELLLVNDSVLGPLHPLEPAVATLRAGGNGLFGMLESLQGGPHLQSWFLLARGRAAVDDVADFLRHLRLTASKWLLIQRAELSLGRHMLARGHRVAALYSYASLVEDAIADATERDYLLRWEPGLEPLLALPEAECTLALRARFEARPLNPAHHLWRALLRAGCPFLKTELVRRNPGSLPEVDTWRSFVPPDAPCPVPVIEAHLAALEAPPAATRPSAAA